MGGGGCWLRLLRSSVQRFAAVAFLVQAALAALHHVNKVGQRLLLVHRDVSEVTTHSLRRREGGTDGRRLACFTVHL